MTTTVRPTRQLEVRGDDSALLFTQQARKTLRDMTDHIAKLRGAYGEHHAFTADAAKSFARIMESMVGWGDVTVTKDGPLSLVCYERLPSGGTGITFGLIFHGTRRACTVKHDGKTCGAILGDDGNVWTYSSRWSPILCEEGEHEWFYPAEAPMPGTWSFHS